LSRVRGNKSRRIPEHLLGRKHCTLTPHVKAADFRLSIFLSAGCWAAANSCVAMQRDVALICWKNNATILPRMLWVWNGKKRRPIRKKRTEKE
jgi:hypothetical protein